MALPRFIRDSLLGVTDLMRGAAGEMPAGEELSPRATLSLMDIPAAGALRGAQAFDPNMLAANWGGKNHKRRLQQLYHGSRGEDTAKGLREQGAFTRGRSAELGIPGTSLSYDPGVSAGQFGGSSPETFFLNRHDIDPSEVYNLRPSDYAAKDYSGAIPSHGATTPGKTPEGDPVSNLFVEAQMKQESDPGEAASYVANKLNWDIDYDPKGGGMYQFQTPSGTKTADDIDEVLTTLQSEFPAVFEKLYSGAPKQGGSMAAVGGNPFEALQDQAENIAEFAGPQQAANMMPHFMQNVKVEPIEQGGPWQATWPDGQTKQYGTISDLIQDGIDHPDVYWSNVADEAEVSSIAKMYSSTPEQEGDSILESLVSSFEKTETPKLSPSQKWLVENDELKGALDNAGFAVVKEGDGYVALDMDDFEPQAIGNTPMEVAGELASKNLISGSDLAKLDQMFQAGRSAGSLDPGAPERGAALVRKPQSYYQEGEYFAPQETGGQGRFTPLAANQATNRQPSGLRQQQRGKNLAKQYQAADRTLEGVRSAVSPQETLSKLAPLKSVEGGAARRELARDAAIALRRQVNAFGNKEEDLVSKAFFPKQYEQMVRLQRLAQDIEDARNLQEQRKSSAVRGPRRGAERAEFDDAVRQETRAIDRFYKALEESDVPVTDNRRRWDVISGDVARLARMARGQTGPLVNMGPDGRTFAQNLKQLITQAGAEGVPIRQFATRLQNDLLDRGPITSALARNDVEEAMQALARGAARDEFDMDNPEDIMR
jgi:hypothetical protein